MGDGRDTLFFSWLRLARLGRQCWLALLVLCASVLMIVLDTTIVNVALPSISAWPCMRPAVPCCPTPGVRLPTCGWTSGQSLGLLGTAVVLLVLFLFIEARVPAPLMPLGLFRLRNVAVANVVDRRPNSTLRAWSPRRSGNSPLKPCALKRAAMRLPCPR